jgi:PAS domain S-box-containing protein
MFNNLRQRLLLFMILAGLVPLGTLMFTAHTVLHRAILESEKEKVTDISRHLSRLVTEIMDRSARDLRSLASNPILSDPEAKPEEQLGEMRRIVRVYDAFSAISLYGPDGYILRSTAENHPVLREDSTWFEDALGGKTTISPPQRKPGSDGLFLSVYLPAIGKDGEVGKVIKASLSFARVLDVLSGVTVGQKGEVVLLDAWGNVISGHKQARLLEEFDRTLPPDHWQNNPTSIYHGRRGHFLYSATTISATATHTETPWTLLAMRPMSEVNVVMHETSKSFLYAVAALLIASSSAAYYLAGKISKPIENAGRVAAEVAAGNLDAVMPTTGPGELRRLATLFNGMVGELRQHRFGLQKIVRHRTDSLRRSQAKLLRLSAHLRAAINSTNNGFLVTDAEGRVAVCNPLFPKFIGLENELAVGRDLTPFFGKLQSHSTPLKGKCPDWSAPVEKEAEIDVEIMLNDASHRVLHVFSAPLSGRRGENIGRVWTLSDLTAQRNLEEGLRQSQKMEAVGQLAGGVAHDFNNLLTGILGNLALVELELEHKENFGCQDNLLHAIRAGERAAELVKQLLGFSRRSQMNLSPCEVGTVITDVKNILSATMDRSIRIEIEDAPNAWPVLADANMLSQVLLNMGVNAKDAMPQGGTIRFSTANHFISGPEARRLREASPGAYLRISVQDTGIGMSPEVQAHVFEPFYTTKPPGKGTGLGLATSFGIIKQLGGWIELYSKTGEGTRFDIFLPRHTPTTPPALATTQAPIPKAVSCEPVRNHETILIVDDEEVVRRVASTLLAKLGYKVMIARDGREGLEVYEENRDQIDLVLLDLTMPNLSGKDAFRILRERFGPVPVVICSGYLLDLKEFASECGSTPCGFIQKPYKLETMARTIREILDESALAAV